MASASSVTTCDGTFSDADMETVGDLLPEIDGALLTALLEESSQEDDAIAEQPGYFMTSLEADITAAGGGSTSGGEPAHGDQCEDCRLEELLLEKYDCWESACVHADDTFDWMDVCVLPAALNGADDVGSGDMGMVGSDYSRAYWQLCGMSVEDVCDLL